MALTDAKKEIIRSWFDSGTKEYEYAWAERLQEVTTLYEEMGFTRGEGAILFMLNQLLMQTSLIATIVKRWDEEGET